MIESEARAEQVEAFLAERKKAGSSIDPENVEFSWGWADVSDPYGVDPMPPEYRCVGRVYFIRTPGSDIWVEFGDYQRPYASGFGSGLTAESSGNANSAADEDADLPAVALSRRQKVRLPSGYHRIP